MALINITFTMLFSQSIFYVFENPNFINVANHLQCNAAGGGRLVNPLHK